MNGRVFVFWISSLVAALSCGIATESNACAMLTYSVLWTLAAIFWRENHAAD
jgi:hypothetical protein